MRFGAYRLVRRALARAPRRIAAATALVALALSYWTTALSRRHAAELAARAAHSSSNFDDGQTVRIRVAGGSEAEVLLDGQIVGTVPLQIAVPVRPGARVVEVRLPGFAPWQRRVDGYRDAYLLPVLEKSP
jgi:hypothetical protein